MTTVTTSPNSFAVIILAAGSGTRMKSSLPKVMHPLAGKPMLKWIFDEVRGLNPDQIITVISPSLLSSVEGWGIDYAVQENANGTGSALSAGMKKLRPHIERVLVVCVDLPLLTKESLMPFVRSSADLVLGVMTLSEEEKHKPYGRIIHDQTKNSYRIVEWKDARQQERDILTVNAGLYVFKTKDLQHYLPEIRPNNASQEYYLTDIVSLITNDPFFQHAELCSVPLETLQGVNTQEDLAACEHVIQSRLRRFHLLNGVRLMDPSTVYFPYDTQIEPGVVIYPHNTFLENVQIQSGAIIYGFCYLSDCSIGPSAKVGPFAHLRGNCRLEEQSEIGNFVELKKTVMGRKAKAKHLSYLGDAVVGESSNIGAGVITCNYNGFEKSKTHIGRDVFVGSNSALVAPLTLDDGCLVAAGSTLTRSVEKDALALSRTQQTNVEKGADRFRSRFNKK